MAAAVKPVLNEALLEAAEENDDESSSSSSDDEGSTDENEEDEDARQSSLNRDRSSVSAPSLPGQGPGPGATMVSGSGGAGSSSMDAKTWPGATGSGGLKARGLWKKAGEVVRAQVVIKKTFGGMLAASSAKLQALEDSDRNWLVAKLFTVSVLLNVMDTESKACAFHSSAVGKYSVDGKPYKFSYSLFVALLVFIIKLGLGPLKKWLHNMDKEEHRKRKTTHEHMDKEGHTHRKSPKHTEKAMDRQKSEAEERHDVLKQAHALNWCGRLKLLLSTHGSSFREIIMPWVLLIAFTLCEMVSVTLANYALNVTPTSIFIVFKSSKMVIVAVASWLFMGANLRKAQWVALLLMVVALLIATVAENKGGTKHGGGLSLQGPILLLLSEGFYAVMLILQQIAVRDYWPEPMLLVSASSLIGIPMTLASMAAAMKITSPLPPHHPVSDPGDVFVMCSNSYTLTLAIVAHLGFRVSLDAYHIHSAKHLSALARAMTDIVKLGVMWILGKVFWLIGYLIWKSAWPRSGGVLAVLAEPWRPHSWMMIPGLMLIGYALLMFKYKDFVPIRVSRSNGQWEFEIVEVEQTAEEKKNGFLEVDTGFDDCFYNAAFTNRKVRKNMQEHFAEILINQRNTVKTVFHTNQPKNAWQRGALKARRVSAVGETGKVAAES